jgi:hypothetical protein
MPAGMLARRIRTDGFVDPCIPMRAGKPPWVHEIKHDGYRLIVRRDGEAVRPFTHRLEPLRCWNPLPIEAPSDTSVI